MMGHKMAKILETLTKAKRYDEKSSLSLLLLLLPLLVCLKVCNIYFV